MNRLAVVALTLTAAAACGGVPTSATSDDSQAQTGKACSLSPIGQAVFAAARSGDSTVIPLGVTTHNRVASGPIVGGEAFAHEAEALIASAKKQVLVTSFLIQDGWIASRLRQALEALDSSVEVFVMVNADREAWVQEEPTATIARVTRILNPSGRANIVVGAWDAPDARPGGTSLIGLGLQINHDKSIVVDGERALIGNINMELSADPTSQNPKGGWYQYALRLEGDIAAQLASEMTGAWQHHGVTDPGAPKPIPWALAPARPPSEGFCTPMIPLGRAAGASDTAAANRGIAALFDSARQTLRIITPDLNAPTARQAIARATKNAEVRLVLSHGFLDGLEKFLGGTNDANLKTLADEAAASGNPCNLHVRWYSSAEKPNTAVSGGGRGASHAKWASADGQLMIVGSQNLDVQSWSKSQELNVAVDDPTAVRAFDDEFDRAYARSVTAFEKNCR